MNSWHGSGGSRALAPLLRSRSAVPLVWKSSVVTISPLRFSVGRLAVLLTRLTLASNKRIFQYSTEEVGLPCPNQNKALMRRLVEELWNQKKPAVIDQLYADIYIAR